MRYLFDGRIPIEWVFTVGKESTLAAYPGNLEDDLAAMAGRLRNYADGKLNAAGTRGNCSAIYRTVPESLRAGLGFAAQRVL